MSNNDPKKNPNPAGASEPDPTDPAVTTEGELGEEDLDAVSGGLRSTDGTILTTKPPVCVTRLP